MTRRPASLHSGDKDPTAVEPDQLANLDRREALARLSQYAAAGYIAPAMLTLLVSKKASASSDPPPPPPS